MLADKKPELTYTITVQFNNTVVLEQNGAKILETINKTQSICETAKNLNVSYRYVWNYIHRIQNVLGQSIVETFKGGKDGGGGTKLTKQGKALLSEYRQAEQYMNAFLCSSKAMEVKSLKLSARNQFKGKVVSVEEGVITAKVKVEVQVPTTITAVITKEAVEELGLKVGDEVAAIVKSTEIMIAK
ncbi:MAG: TOBE domain-containing protein [Candidatus Bathyarchaeia archaeon]|jgi:molybdate transport system regulatory protein